ncbi:MAG: hypothetical protein AAFX81_19185 [Pseudomonadota bacterium]
MSARIASGEAERHAALKTFDHNGSWDWIEFPPFDPRTASPLADLGRAAAEAPDGGWQREGPDA